MKKLIILVFMCIVLVSLVSAQLSFKKNTTVDIKVPCRIEGDICGATAKKYNSN